MARQACSLRSPRRIKLRPARSGVPGPLPSAKPWARDQRTQGGEREAPIAPQAVEPLAHDGDRLVTGDQFPQEHGRHLWTTLIVESPVATVRLHATAAK